jgi:hypothetical protein
MTIYHWCACVFCLLPPRQVNTVYNGVNVRIPLRAGTWQLELTVTDPTNNATATGLSNQKVIPLPGGKTLPTMAGSCGPFRWDGVCDVK